MWQKVLGSAQGAAILGAWLLAVDISPAAASPFRELEVVERAPVAPPSDQPAIQQNRLWAFVVGVNQYQSRNVPRLQFAVNDARAIRDRIVRRVPALKVNEAHLEDQEATKDRILAALDELSHAHADDIILVYLSAHGIADKSGKDGFIVAYDTDPWNIESTGVAISTILDRIARVPAKRLFLIIDACFSGTVVGTWGARAKTFNFGPATRAAVMMTPDVYNAVRSQRGHFVISASRSDEPSLELESLGHGLFTYYLIEGLEGGAARPGNAYVTITDLYDYVSNRVGLFARSLNQTQTPMMHGNFDGPPPFVTVLSREGTESRESEFERLVREARLSFESSRLIVAAPALDRVELLIGGALQESWKAGSKQVRIPKEAFERYGTEITITLRASRDGRKTEEKILRLRQGEERRVAIESSELPRPSAAPRPPFFPPPAP